jgi:hypothetical protein
MKSRILNLSSLSLLFVGLLYAPADYSAKLVSKKKGRKDKSSVTFNGGSGVGVFKDIQVPINDFAQTRGDGAMPAEEFQNHMGFPLFVGLKYKNVLGNWRPKVGAELLSISAASGPPATQSSSYTRFNLGTGIDYLFNLGSLKSHIGLQVNARRSSFDNLSNGHHINAAYVGLNVGIIKRRSFKVSSFAAVAPVSELRFHKGNNVAGNKFASGSSNVSEMGFMTSLNISKHAWFDIGYEQEKALLKIEDVSDYNGFGLGVTPTAQSNRVYSFTTDILRLGFHKNF